MKKIMAVAALVLTGLMFASCVIESEAPEIRSAWIVNDPAHPDYPNRIDGFVDITGPGWSGRYVYAELFLVDGHILSVRVDVSSQTQRFVSPLPGAIEPLIRHTNSFNFPNTIVSGATITAQSLTEAARAEFIRRGVLPDTVGF